MLILTSLYNLVMAFVDVAALQFLSRHRTTKASFSMLIVTGLIAGVLAVVFGMSRFGLLRLACYGIFLHGTLLLVGSTVLLWRKRRWVAVASGLPAVALIAVAVDAFLIEPTWLEVTHHKISSPKLERAMRIVVLADLQADQFGPYERMVFHRVLEEKPDLILLVGDYLQVRGDAFERLRTQLGDFLQEIDFDAPSGVYAVSGNIDGNRWPKIFADLPVTVAVSRGSFEPAGIKLTCLSLGDSGNRRLSISRSNDDRFHIVLGHRPNFALGSIDADLLIAGHTHGGQVRLPFIGPLLTASNVPRNLASGLNDLSSGAKILVSRGVGMERGSAPRLRFLCRPELTVIDLLPTQE